jgi:hypothetical protein
MTVYVADVPRASGLQERRARLCRDLRNKGFRPVCETPWPAGLEGAFEEAVGSRMSKATAYVSLLTSPAAVEGWDRTPAEIEMAKALDSTERTDSSPLLVFLWTEPKQPTPATWTAYIQRADNIRQVQKLLGANWETALSDIQTRLSTQRALAEASGEDPGTGRGSVVFVQCLDEDRGFVRTIQKMLGRYGHRVQYLAQPAGWIFRKSRRGEDLARQRQYEGRYRAADGLLVVHGNGNAGELWCLQNCDSIRDFLREEIKHKVRGVCLVPPEETKDFQDFGTPEFPTYFLSHLEEFERLLPSRDGSNG